MAKVNKTYEKQKFQIGQMVWFIRGGYVSNSRIKSIFIDSYDELVYGVYSGDRDGGYQRFETEDLMSEDSLFASKDALIKSIKEQPDDEE